MRYIFFCLLINPILLFSESFNNPTAPHDLLRHYLGDFTDSDGDGMTDSAENKYGYDPSDEGSLPQFNLGAEPSIEYSIPESQVNNAVIIKLDSGILIKWQEGSEESSYSRYSLNLKDGDRELYYGGHFWDSARVDYQNFELNGDEVLTGRFSEFNPETGEFVANGDWFEVDLSDYPLVIDNELASSSDTITFRFEDFEPALQKKYETFLGKVMPIFIDIAGFPAETFVCTLKLGEEGNSWVTLDQGRTIVIDDGWLPRLFIHELIHVWKGKYAFSYTGESWSYEEKLNGFEEIAEGLAYEILHEYAESYPNDETSLEILQNGPWWNWSSQASNYDTVKHQPHTGAGTFWSGETLFSNDRYSISAMLIQIIHVHDPDFFRNTMQAYYRLIESDPEYRPTRGGLLDLWSSEIEEINGIDSRSYLATLPVLNGDKLAQRYYPVIYQSESYSNGTSKTIFGSYALEGYLWWFSGNTPSEIVNYNIPSWVRYNENEDGYLYVDSNNQPFRVTVQNIFGETINEYSSVLDTGYQDDQETIPNNLFTERIPQLDSEILPTGLYIETLEFTELAKYTEYAEQSFYAFGYEGFEQHAEEYSLFFGFDSKFPSQAEITFGEHFFDLPIVNGCAVLKTSAFPLNSQGLLTIKAHSQNGESHTYQRALVNAGSYDGFRHHQFLIIDQDFDGLEDLYDQEIDHEDIALRYAKMKNENSEDPEDPILYSVIVGSVEGGEIMGGGEYTAGEEITISVVPDDGYKFVRWAGDLNGTENTQTFSIQKNLSVGAVFEVLANDNPDDSENPTIYIVDVETVEGGEILGGGEYTAGEKITISVVPDDGYKFVRWAGDLNGTENTQTFSIQENLTVGAVFEVLKNPYFWEQTTDLGQGWRQLDWFGYYYLPNPANSWIYHALFGWIYLIEISNGSFWTYSGEHGWLWSMEDSFPIFYSTDKTGWIYLEKERYYDYSKRVWVD